MKGLSLRNGRWQVRLGIPEECRQQLRKREYVKSLGVISKAEAEIQAMLLLAYWKAEIEHVRGNPSAGIKQLTSKPLVERLQIYETLSAELAQLKPNYTEADLQQYVTEQAVAGQIVDSTSQVNVDAVSAALGIICKPSDHVDEYVSLTLSHLKERSRDEHKSVLEKFCEAFPVLDDKHYSRAKVLAWWDSHVTSGKAQATLRKYLQRVQAFAKWLRHRGYLNKPDHFADIPPITKRQVQRSIKERDEFTDAEVLKLLHFADEQLKPLIMFGAYTGCRIEELCNLSVDDVYSIPIKGARRYYLDIPVSKTKKGRHRKVPLHPLLEEFLPESGYIIDVRDGINKYNERGAGISKKFGRLKSELGFGSDKVFHSLRKSFSTKLKLMHCPEIIGADIVGHEVKSMTYGLYAGGTPVEQLFEWVDKVEYKPTVSRESHQV